MVLSHLRDIIDKHQDWNNFSGRMDDSSAHFVTEKTLNAFSPKKEKIEKATSDFLECINEIRSLDQVMSIKLVWLKIILKFFCCNDRRNCENNIMFIALRFII